MTELKITQADRDAAAAYYYSAGGSPKIANEIREGKKDGWFRVQAFARHRIAAEEGKAELVEAAEALRDDMLERAREVERLRATLGRIASCDLLEVERYYERTWCIPGTGNEYTSREPVFKRSSYQNAEEFQAIARQALGDTQ